ncbi:hypothetical protein EZV62_004996 [Acer yangbiense]|uniref:Uncharacterized protein n=1 Tax=Acer yangbiense TaxID=1000413 RepID=A0A5C7ILH8_9ROSI|nr:hypothetical protein EZV62_004996 [Acer yangbiense]
MFQQMEENVKELNMEKEKDESREAAIASTKILHPNFKPKRLTQDQLSKFQKDNAAASPAPKKHQKLHWGTRLHTHYSHKKKAIFKSLTLKKGGKGKPTCSCCGVTESTVPGFPKLRCST